MSQAIYPRPPEPLVEKNLFRKQKAHSDKIVPFSEAKDRLPVPILPNHPDWIEIYWRAWEMAWSHLHRPKRSSGFVSSFIDAAFNENVFMWDSALMVQFGVYGRRAFPFINSLDNFYAKQHDDGAICREINVVDGSDLYTPFDPDGTGPNILAWAEWSHYRISGDDSRLPLIFWPLLAYHRWNRANRSWPRGLYWATGLSSGMHNQERIPDSTHHHRHWSWVDASMQAAVNCSMLERIANQIGEIDHVTDLTEEHTSLKNLINKYMWNGQTHFYQDIDANGHFSQAKSIGAYWILLDPTLLPTEHTEPFVRHLRDKGVFKVAHRIPTLSADSDGYEPQSGNYWRGAVCSATNYMVLKGLRNIGKNALAHEIATNHLQNVVAVFQHTDTLWQNYAPEAAVSGDPARSNFVGWTGLTPIAMLLEDVIGLAVDWPLRQVVWNRYLDTDGHYGVQNYPLGSAGRLGLMGDREKVVITTDVPFTLTIQDPSLNLIVPVSAGTTEIDLA